MTQSITSDKTLLTRFNSRDESAWGDIYKTLYVELVFFAKRMYANTNVEPRDIVQDIFAKMWESKTLKFDALVNVKAYLYISIKNSFLDYIGHHKCVDKFKHEIASNRENFISEIIEIETLTFLREAADMLPEEIAKVFKMILDGYEVKEIAEKLGKTPSTVYIQKQNAIEILRKKIPPEKIFILTLISIL